MKRLMLSLFALAALACTADAGSCGIRSRFVSRGRFVSSFSTTKVFSPVVASVNTVVVDSVLVPFTVAVPVYTAAYVAPYAAPPAPARAPAKEKDEGALDDSATAKVLERILDRLDAMEARLKKLEGKPAPMAPPAPEPKK